MEPETTVVFRIWRDGEVIALFPEEPATGYGPFCVSFTHIGQHSQANVPYVIRSTRPATEEEYAPLKLELESEPYRYRLKVCRRVSRAMTSRRLNHAHTH